MRIIKKKLKNLLKKYNINKEELLDFFKEFTE